MTPVRSLKTGLIKGTALVGNSKWVPPITVNFLVIGGGGAGGTRHAGGGGAGGYRCSVTGETSGGGSSAESPLSIVLGTNYTVTVGEGGTVVGNNFSGVAGNPGNNSVFATITS